MKVLLVMLLASTASAETMYTSLADTPVRDKPVALGSNVVSHLVSGSMIETVKQVGAFTAVSYIENGKVKTGFIASNQLGTAESASKLGAIPTKVTLAAKAAPSQDLAVVSKLESLQISVKDLEGFATSGKLVDRKPRGK